MEMVVKRTLRKKHSYETKHDDHNENKVTSHYYDLKYLKCPTQRKKLSKLENNLSDIIKSLKFRNVRCQYEHHKELWKLKTQGYQSYKQWETIRKCAPSIATILTYTLCLNDELEIETNNDILLNSRPEEITKCRNINKYLLAKYDVT